MIPYSCGMCGDSNVGTSIALDASVAAGRQIGVSMGRLVPAADTSVNVTNESFCVHLSLLSCFMKRVLKGPGSQAAIVVCDWCNKRILN